MEVTTESTKSVTTQTMSQSSNIVCRVIDKVTNVLYHNDEILIFVSV